MLKKICLFFPVICPVFLIAAEAALAEPRKTLFSIPPEVFGRYVCPYLGPKDWISLAGVSRRGFQVAGYIDPTPYILSFQQDGDRSSCEEMWGKTNCLLDHFPNVSINKVPVWKILLEHFESKRKENRNRPRTRWVEIFSSPVESVLAERAIETTDSFSAFVIDPIADDYRFRRILNRKPFNIQIDFTNLRILPSKLDPSNLEIDFIMQIITGTDVHLKTVASVHLSPNTQQSDPTPKLLAPSMLELDQRSSLQWQRATYIQEGFEFWQEHNGSMVGFPDFGRWHQFRGLPVARKA